MNTDFSPQVKSLLHSHPSLSPFDLYYLGFFAFFSPQSKLQDLFANIKNILELHHDELLNTQEMIRSMTRMLARKVDANTLNALVPVNAGKDTKAYLEEYFNQIEEIIPKYKNITKNQMFFLGYFQGSCPCYPAGEVMKMIDDVNEALGDNFEDEGSHLDFLVKIMDKKIEENANKERVLKMPNASNEEEEPGPIDFNPTLIAEDNPVVQSNGRNTRKRKIDLSELDDEVEKKMTKKTEEPKQQKNGSHGRKIDLQDAEDLEEVEESKGQQERPKGNPVRMASAESVNPFEDLRIEPEPKVNKQKSQEENKYELVEIPVEDIDIQTLTNMAKSGLRRMASAEEEALSRAFIESLQKEEEKEREKRKEKAIEQDTANCAICLDDLYASTFKPLEGCSHVFHEDCMKEYLKSKIDDKGFPMLCPELECKSEITLADVTDFLDQAYQEKFVSFSFKSYLEKHANEVSCCPTADCAFAFVKEDNQVEFKCPVCKKHYCLNCRVVWHKGASCKEYQISHTKDENDTKFEEFVKGAQFKQCPKCGFWVSRTEGCNAMVCRCKTQFCYNCGKEGDGHVCPCLTQARAQPVAGGGLFGRPLGLAAAAAPVANTGYWGGGGGAGGGLFGNPVGGGGLFNNGLGGGGLFNNNGRVWNGTGTGGGLFGNPVGGGGLFNNNAGGGLFRNWYGGNPVYNPPIIQNPVNHFYNPNKGGLFNTLVNPYVAPPTVNYDDDEDDEDYHEGDELSDPGNWNHIVPLVKKKKARRKKRN